MDQHQNQECSTPSSAENCCSVSLALAQPRLISIQEPWHRISLLHVVPRCCGSCCRLFALQPQQVQSNTCSLPLDCVYVRTVCPYGLQSHSSCCAAQSYKDRPPRPEADRIGSGRRQPRTGNSRAYRGPWSTNAEEMTLWICSAARNEGKMAERVPRTMQGCDGNTGHTVPRVVVAHPRPLWFCQARCLSRHLGRTVGIGACNWRKPSPDSPLQHFLPADPAQVGQLIAYILAGGCKSRTDGLTVRTSSKSSNYFAAELGNGRSPPGCKG